MMYPRFGRAVVVLGRALFGGGLALLLACSNPNVTSGVGGGGASGSGATSGGGAARGGGAGAGGVGPGVVLPPISPGTADAGGTGLRTGNGTPELCDGIDNDDNGLADDIDVDSDGICDCLRIATLGKSGVHGTGNVFAGWLAKRSVNGAVQIGSERLTPERLAGLQVIVALDLSETGRTYDVTEIAALTDWIKKGGGFLTLIGFAGPSERTNANSLLAPFGIQYGSDQILPKNGSMTVPVTTWKAHPITAKLKAVGVDNGYPVTGEGTVLATGFEPSTGKTWDVLRVREVDGGRVAAWADEWVTYDSEWSTRADYQVELFWVNIIKYLTPPKQCQVAIPPRLIP